MLINGQRFLPIRKLNFKTLEAEMAAEEAAMVSL